MCILKGFPTALKSTIAFPFGIWFANPDTPYIADEGNGTATYANVTYTAAAASATAGLQKWAFNSGAGKWELAYTLQSGLELGQPYTVAGSGFGAVLRGVSFTPGTR